MKTVKSMLVLSILLASCAVDRKERAQQVMNDLALREEIFHVIQNDSTLIRDLMVSMTSVQEDPKNYKMRYRMIKLAFNSPVMDSLLVNDSQLRAELFQKMLIESDHNVQCRQDMSNAIARHKALHEMIKKTGPERK
jgi:hypothetical protein